jgi:hypothetical protein
MKINDKDVHVGICGGATFMNKLKNGKLEIDTCPQVEVGPDISEEYVDEKLEAYQRLLDSGLIDGATDDKILYVRGGNGNPANLNQKMVNRLYDMMQYQETCSYKGYGQDDDEIVTVYLASHLEGGIKQKNLDKVLDLMDEYVEIAEATSKEEQGPVKKLVPNNKK